MRINFDIIYKNRILEVENITYIIRKTKCSEEIKRSIPAYKTKCSFLGFLPNVKNAPEKTEAFIVSYHYLSNIQVKFHTLISIKQSLGTVYIILVYVHIAEIQRYIL